jgi:hypothetical protein
VRHEAVSRRRPAAMSRLLPDLLRLLRRPASDPTLPRGLTGWQWVFRSRQTGRLTIAQWPNPPLWAWIATTLTRRLPPVDGRADTVLAAAGTAALVVWAIGELWRGVNPWRRLLGFAVLLGVLSTAVTR